MSITHLPANPPGPEFTYFPDGQGDRMAALVWQLAQELHVTRQRLLHLEQLLVDDGTLRAGQLDEYVPAPEHADRMAADGTAMVDRLIRVLAETDDRRAPMRAQYESRFTAPKSTG